MSATSESSETPKSGSACTSCRRPPAAGGRASASAAARAPAPARPPAAARRAWGSRSGAKDRARFEGGQMPIHMRMRKLRGPHMKKSMPFEPFRTHTQPVNIADLEARFEAGADVTLEALQRHGPRPRARASRSRSWPRASCQGPDRPCPRLQQAARERIKAAGGDVVS